MKTMRLNYRILPAICCALWLTLTVSQAQTYFPDRGEWQSKTPGDVGMNAAAVAAAVSFAENNEYSGSVDLRIATYESFRREPFHELTGPTKKRGGPAGMIIKDGYVVAQWGDVDRVDMTFSATKSYLSTTAGLAFDAGLISDMDDKVGKYVWDGTFDGRQNSKVTWDHLLTQSSDWTGELFGGKDWADRPPSEGDIDDWKIRKFSEPGTVFEYNDVRVNVAAYALLNVWRKPLPQILKERVMDPIGASTTWRWYGYTNSFVLVDGVQMQSVSGGGHNGGGLFINTMDHARFGYLFLRQGNWKGEQLISDDWVNMIQKPSQANVNYGYMWWLNQKGSRHWEGVPESVYYAAGFGGNFIVVDNSNDLVIVTRWLEPSKIGELVKMVIDAVK
jgi:CubicO group peptidase (beta-lactamase class C family)